MDVDIEFMPYRVHYTNKSCIKWHETVWSCFRGNPFLIINRQKYKEWQVVQIKEVSEPRTHNTHDTHDTHDVLLVNKRESLEGQSDGVVFKLHLLCDGKQIPDHHNNSRCFSFYSSGVDFIIGRYLKWTLKTLVKRAALVKSQDEMYHPYLRKQTVVTLQLLRASRASKIQISLVVVPVKRKRRLNRGHK